MSESTKSTGAVVAAVVAVLAVVAVVVGFQVLGGSGEEPAATGGSTTAPEENPAPAPGECTEPPEPPTSPMTFDEVPDQGIAEDSIWQATLATNCGDIVVELYGDKAPQTVSSFLYLAEQGYWEDSPCHRLVPQGIFVLQCGDPTGTGTGGPGYGFGIENAPSDGQYPPGTLAMARTQDPNSNGGQFFIVYEQTRLPVEGGGYTIFGEVVDGMEIVDKVAASGLGGSLGPEAPKQPISILDVTTEQQ